MEHFHDLKQQQNNTKPIFDVIEPSIVRAQFSTKKDASFPSYLYQSKNHQQNKFTSQVGQSRTTEDSDQISIFDAAKYFSGLHDDDNQKEPPPPSKGGGVNNLAPVVPPRLSSVSSSVDDSGSNYGGKSSTTCTSNNTYRARSFHATPTASSEASWNSQAGLLSNPPGYTGVNIPKTLSPNSSSNNSSSTTTPRWPRISTKWLIPRRKCPCSGKKSVQVEEGVESTTPRMVDLRRSTSSNGSATNYISSSWYSPRQNSSKIIGTTSTTSPTTNVVTPQEPRNNNSNFSLSVKIPNAVNHHHSNNPRVVGPLKSFTNNHSEIISPSVTTVTTTTATATTAATIGGTTTSTSTATNGGFTFPILENSPLGVKKMFTVIADPPRDSLEVFQPRSHTSPSSKSRRTSYEDENVLSDGSSDLFEIDSFSTSYPCNRDSLDELVVVPASSFNSSSTMKKLGIVCNRSNNNVDENDGGVVDDDNDEPMTPHTECYAPSEASIDWSVTTAEGTFVSGSEMGMYAAMRRESERNNGGGGGGGKGEEKRSSSSRQGGGGKGNNNNGSNNVGGLLSCRCEKAVSVGPGPIKCSAEGAHRSRRGM